MPRNLFDTELAATAEKAPVIFFDDVALAGTRGSIVGIAISACREYRHKGKLDGNASVQALLRCDLAAAKLLRDGLDALLNSATVNQPTRSSGVPQAPVTAGDGCEAHEDRPLLVPIAEAARQIGLCRQTLYRMEKDAELSLRRLRGRTFVPTSEIDRLTRPSPPPAKPAEPPEPKAQRPKKVRLFPSVTA